MMESFTSIRRIRRNSKTILSVVNFLRWGRMNESVVIKNISGE